MAYTINVKSYSNPSVQDQSGAFTFIETPVSNSPPVANPGGPYIGLVNQQMTFVGSGSYDTDGNIVRYEWNFGDGRVGEGVTAAHTYTYAGIFTVTLIVTDDKGLVDSDSTYAGISSPQAPNIPPIANAGGVYTCFVNDTVSLNGLSSRDLDGSISDYRWSFDNGQYSSGSIVSHVFTHVGASTVILTVTDNQGATDTDTGVVQVQARENNPETPHNHPPTVIVAGPYTGVVDSSIYFYVHESGDIDGTIVEYIWDFGDGSTNSTGDNANHIYTTPGEYMVTLTVVDNMGAVNTSTTTATIAPNNIIPPKPSTPGFEVVIFLCAIATFILYRKYYRR
jgi:PKD repeat protein